MRLFPRPKSCIRRGPSVSLHKWASLELPFKKLWCGATLIQDNRVILSFLLLKMKNEFKLTGWSPQSHFFSFCCRTSPNFVFSANSEIVFAFLFQIFHSVLGDCSVNCGYFLPFVSGRQSLFNNITRQFTTGICRGAPIQCSTFGSNSRNLK